MRFQVNCPLSSLHFIILREREISNLGAILLILSTKYSHYSIIRFTSRQRLKSDDIFQRIDFTILCTVKGIFFLFMTAVFVNTTEVEKNWSPLFL